MKPHGGFEHNLQSLRVVDVLEQRYAAFDGLNLTFETREGILKHCSTRDARELGDVGERFLKKRRPSLEAQIANVADEIAYNNHDVDDGLRSGLLDLEELSGVSLFRRHRAATLQVFPGLTGRRLIHETIRRMIDTLVTDLIEASSIAIRREKPGSLEDVRSAPALIGFSGAVREEQLELKRFLHEKLYRHYRVARMSSKARRIVTELFDAFLAEPSLLPPEFQSRASEDKARAIADYVAGMTDRYAMLEHRRLFAIEAS
jgi:dGTPase